jgi:long-subunit acyl-CoA synthetase (AMP-forming)
MYTSGTTGTPEGVPLKQAEAVAADMYKGMGGLCTCMVIDRSLACSLVRLLMYLPSGYRHEPNSENRRLLLLLFEGLVKLEY